MSASGVPRLADSLFEHYRPLSKLRKQIRLLVVAPGRDSDIICGWLQHALLDHEVVPRYETISYCWGDPKIRDWILVDGYLVTVPASAVAAIRRVRLAEGWCTLWIDAVCINQSDLQERSAQVTLMDLVYSMANTNLIYLGADEEGLAEQTLNILEKTAQQIKKEVHAPETPWIDKAHYEVYGTVPDALFSRVALSEETFNSLLPLYNLPWFRRLWVLQEAVLASRNMCYWGHTTFPLEIATKLAHLVHMSGAWIIDFPAERAGAAPAREMQRLSQNLRVNSSLVYPFNMLRYVSERSLTTEPRDHVFALLGLFRRQHSFQKVPAFLTPDYQKSAVLVFRDATRFLLNETTVKRLDEYDPLSEVRHRSQADITANGVTSWTLKWDRKFMRNLDPLTFSGCGNCLFRAGIPPYCERDEYLCKIADPTDLDVLTFKGYVVGTIGASTPQIVRGVDPASEKIELPINDPIAILAVLDSVISAVTDGPYDHADIYSVAAELLTFEYNKVALGFPEFSKTEFRKVDGLKELMRLLRETGDFPPALQHIPHPLDVPYDTLVCSMFFNVLRKMVCYRRFFTTDTGRLGIGPKVLVPGDCIAAFHGKLPLFVLRPIGKEYQFIGAAYVAGLMHGEVFDMGLPSVWIDIR